jgi:hypothetical protein
MQLAIKEDVVMLSLGLPHVLHLQLKKCPHKRAGSEAHWLPSSDGTCKGITHTRLTVPQLL